MPDIVADGFHWTQEPWGRALRSRPLAAIADHFFTSLPLRLRGEDGEEERDWRRVAGTIGVPIERLLRLQQVHGNAVVVARAGASFESRLKQAGAGLASHQAAGGTAPSFPRTDSGRPLADILASDDPTVALAIQVADCVPLLIADRATGAVAAAHAGWRGTAANVAATAVAALAREFGSQPADLVVAHGPSIGPWRYTVGEELVGEFERSGFGASVDRWFQRDGDGTLRLDLWMANRDQLLACGVPPEAIHQSELCTASHPTVFPSYRRDGKGTGRIAGVIRARAIR